MILQVGKLFSADLLIKLQSATRVVHSLCNVPQPPQQAEQAGVGTGGGWPAKADQQKCEKSATFPCSGIVSLGTEGQREATCGMARGAAARRGAAPLGAQEPAVVFVTQADLQHMKRIPLPHSCVTRFGKYEALFLLNANE